MAKDSAKLINEKLAHARDGEVVLYKRGDSAKWQARFKLKDMKWHRVATKHMNLKYASEVACEAYDKARFLFDENMPLTTKRFDAVAKITVTELERQLAAGVGKVVYVDYIRTINKYLAPYFGQKNINNIGYEEIKAFNEWRIAEMGRNPVVSTITTHNSAFNRVFDTAVEHGWISAAAVPKMKNNGTKGGVREALSYSEYKRLVGFMPSWVDKAHTAKSRQMRELLRDYVLVLANTGIRHGTEALGLKWRDIEWVTKDKVRYLEFTVDGKVGKRELIARHNTEDYLRRLQLRQDDIKHISLDTLLKRRVNEPVFKLRNGETTRNLNGTFRSLMRDSGIDKDKQTREKRTLYSLRHTYAHFSLLLENMDVYTLAEQMGTSVKMIEMHYGHLKPKMKANIIAGKRMNQRERGDKSVVANKVKLKVVK